MKDIVLTADEIIETLKRSDLPTVLTEGKDDYSVFRFLEDEMNDLSVSIMPVGGKSKLTAVFNRRSEIPEKIFFVFDRDLSVFENMPDHLSRLDRLVFTHGYSIENDVYVDGKLESLLSRQEKLRFLEDVNEISIWYASCVEKIRSGHSACLKHNPKRILGGPNRKMTSEYKSEISFAEPDEAFVSDIKLNYTTLLRGKRLLSLLAQHLSAPKRRAKHSFAGLLEIGSRAQGPLLKRISDAVRSFFSPPATRGVTPTDS